MVRFLFGKQDRVTDFSVGIYEKASHGGVFLRLDFVYDRKCVQFISIKRLSVHLTNVSDYKTIRYTALRYEIMAQSAEELVTPQSGITRVQEYT